MEAPMSLAQELRAIRNAGNDGRPKHMFDFKESERPWQADINRVQQSLQEVLQAIARLSGVELPGVDLSSQSPGNPPPKLDWKDLKDRIYNDLEAFSIKTATEMVKRSEEQTRAVLEAIQGEAGGQFDRISGEFRERLQELLDSDQIEVDLLKQSRDRVAELVQAQTDEFAQWVWLMCKGTGTPIPAQIEKFLQPYVEESTAKLTGTIRQQVQDLLAEQEQVAHDRLQGTIGSFQNQMGAIEQTAQQICEQKADEAAKLSADRLGLIAEEASKDFESKVTGEVEEVLGQTRTRLEDLRSTFQETLRREGENQEEGFQHRLEGLASEVQEKRVAEISSRIEQVAADVLESSFQHVHQQAGDALESSKGEFKGFMQNQTEAAREQVREIGRSMYESLSQDAAKLADTLRGVDQELMGVAKRHVAASEKQLSSLVQATMESLNTRIKDVVEAHVEQANKLVRDLQDKAASQYESQLRDVTETHYNDLLRRTRQEAGEAGAKVAAEVKATSESVMQELSNKVSASASVLREEATHATSRIESSLTSYLETYKQQLAQITDTGLEEQRKAITNSIADLHDRLKQAADLLVLGKSGN